MLITLLIILIKTTILTILEKNCKSNEWGNQAQSLGHTTIDSLVAEHFIRNSSGQYIYIYLQPMGSFPIPYQGQFSLGQKVNYTVSISKNTKYPNSILFRTIGKSQRFTTIFLFFILFGRSWFFLLLKHENADFLAHTTILTLIKPTAHTA